MGQSDRSQAISVTDTGTGLGRLGEIAAVFLKLGIFGFGGPVATMAMMEEEAVRARHWITPEEFAEIYAVCKILPGPVSTQMAIYLGRIRGGVRGGVTAGVVFILPCFLMVLGLAILYTETGVVRGAEAVLSGLQAAALSIILISTWGLGKTYRKQLAAWAVVVVSGVLIYLYPRYEPLVILGFGFIGVMQARGGSRAVTALCGGLVTGGLLAGRTAAAAIWAIPSDPSVLLNLFWMCLKAGFLVFGTGLAVVPVLEGEAVRQYHWLTHSQFMDGLAVGQITPGPVVITSTFIGYLAARLPGALAATAGMFLPSFINVLYLVPRVWRKFSGTPGAKGFSAFAIPAVIGGILGTTIKLGLLTLTAWQPITVFTVALVIAAWLKPPAWLLIPLAGVAGGLLGKL